MWRVLRKKNLGSDIRKGGTWIGICQCGKHDSVQLESMNSILCRVWTNHLSEHRYLDARITEYNVGKSYVAKRAKRMWWFLARWLYGKLSPPAHVLLISTGDRVKLVMFLWLHVSDVTWRAMCLTYLRHLLSTATCISCTATPQNARSIQCQQRRSALGWSEGRFSNLVKHHPLYCNVYLT